MREAVLILVVFFALWCLWLITLCKWRSARYEDFVTNDPDVAPQCRKWYTPKLFWRYPPFSWLDMLYTFTTEVLLGVIWFVKYELS